MYEHTNKKYKDKEYCYYATYTYRDKIKKRMSTNTNRKTKN